MTFLLVLFDWVSDVGILGERKGIGLAKTMRDDKDRQRWQTPSGMVRPSGMAKTKNKLNS